MLLAVQICTSVSCLNVSGIWRKLFFPLLSFPLLSFLAKSGLSAEIEGFLIPCFKNGETYFFAEVTDSFMPEELVMTTAIISRDCKDR